MGLNDTPSGNRTHIGFFGIRNAGKSSVVNAVTAQDIAVVSDIKGTTTDPVYKSMIGRMLSISGERYEYEMNQLLYFGRRKLRILEVPIETVYEKGNKSSHFDAVKDSWRIYTNIFKYMKA